MLETGVQSLGQEDPLEKEMATHSSILAWEIPWTEEPGRLQPMGFQSGTAEHAHMRAVSHCACMWLIHSPLDGRLGAYWAR